MLSLVSSRYLEASEKMEGKRSLNLVRDEDLGLGSSSKDGGGGSSYYASPDVSNTGGHEGGGAHQVHGKSFKEFQIQNVVDSETSAGALAGYGNLLGPGDYRRLGQWSESLSEHSERYKREIGEVADVNMHLQEERRVRSRPEASAMLTNLLGRRDETDLHMSISARTLRPSGGKDRHSKVFTAKGPRDRRVRLSVSTAIQFYDVQDRLGYDQPSKAVEWLMKKAKNAIDELSQIPLPGIDRLVVAPSSSNSIYHPYGSYDGPSEFLTQSTSSSDVQLKGGMGVHVQQASVSNSGELPTGSEVKASSSREQAVDESDTFLSTRHQQSGGGGSTRRGGELATDITMSVGDRKNQVHVHYHGHHHPLSSFSSPPSAATPISNSNPNTTTFLPPSAASSSGGRQSWKSLSPHAAGGTTTGYHMFDHDPCSSSLSEQQHQHHQRNSNLQMVFHGGATAASPFQYHQQLNIHQPYLQHAQQDFLAGGGNGGQPGHGLVHGGPTVLPFGMMPGASHGQGVAGTSPTAKGVYLDHLKMPPRNEKASPVVIGMASPSVTSSSSSPGGRAGFGGLVMGSSSPSTATGAAQQQQQQHLVGGFHAAEPSDMIQSLDEHLRKKTI